MQTSVTFKNLESSESLVNHVSEKLEKIDKFLDNPAEADVVLCVEKFRHIAEVKISGDRLNITSKEETNDMYTAVDAVVERLLNRIKKSKEKIRDHRIRAKGKMQVAEDVMEFAERESDFGTGRPEVKITNIEYKPMGVEEAVMQFEMMSDNFLVFTNAKSERVNVLYRRKDGDYGLIQPSR